MNNAEKKTIASFFDLEVYQNSYSASITVMTKVLPKIPDTEKNDLRDQMSRACKAIPRLIAEGYAKKHQRLGFQKYFDDAMGESNEMIVCLSHCRDIYSKYIPKNLCEELIDTYDKTGRQLYNLSEAWQKFKTKGRRTT
jgi:four helix bundle protein